VTDIAKHLVDLAWSRAEKLQHIQAKEWAKAALVGAVTATPGPGDTKYATGCARASTWTSSNVPRRFDPGKRSVYQIPTARRALYGIRGRKAADDVVLNEGVFYDWNVARYHRPIAIGHRAGRAELGRAKSAHIKKAMSGRRRIVTKV